jgi:hypothetical protein
MNGLQSRGAWDGFSDGVDLSGAHKGEIAEYATVWDWIKARIQAGFFAGIQVGDYIPLTLSDGKAFKMEVAGIDTYYRYGNPAVGHHIDFISHNCHPDAHAWNKANYNNGTTVSPHPWLASDLYAWLNSLAMQVPNEETANPALVSVNYGTTGVYDKLPAALQAVIVNKHMLLPIRYTAGALLTDDNSWNSVNVGKLWIPSEIEVFGYEHFGSKNGYSGGGFQQYLIFVANMRQIKGSNDSNRTVWWVLSAYGGDPWSIASVNGIGGSVSYIASQGNIRVPICFRIA